MNRGSAACCAESLRLSGEVAEPKGFIVFSFGPVGPERRSLSAQQAAEPLGT